MNEYAKRILTDLEKKASGEPEFLQAAKSAEAIPLYEFFLRRCRERGFPVETGEFGAEMQVASVNDGPVTLILDTEQL